MAYAETATHTSGNTTNVVYPPLAEAQLDCGSTTGTGSNSVPNIPTHYVYSAQPATDTYDASGSTITSTSTLGKVSVLNGLITADAIKAQSQSNASTLTSSTTGSFTNLVVQGTKVAGLPRPNTTMTLNGWGYVVLNNSENPVSHAKTSSTGSKQTSALVNMLYVVINVANNPLRVPAGTTIIVGSASTAYTVPPAPYAVDPTAYSFLATGYNNSLSNVTGPLAIASVACNANIDEKSVGGENTPVGSVGAMYDKSTTTQTTTTTNATAASSTASASLLNGLIVTKNLQATASMSRDNAKFTPSGSIKFTSLSINGKPVAASVKPNTKINVNGLGYVAVNEQYIINANGSASIQLSAVDLNVTVKNNKYNLAVGSHVVLGHAAAQITHQ
ncbi:MAG: hypothetical protein JO199_08100 [Candidatus Eremiobacteraeota bacterium]|nr:hypothetical protein [Candidatus Eremiobacteraeota bacterium]